MKAVFLGGPLDGQVLPFCHGSSCVNPFGTSGTYDLARIERTPGPDGIDSETAVYEFRWPDKNPSQSL